jgi:2-oxoglutarate dehydrogenase E2 component (dihydrolipoamide succinyltransferase)
MIIEIQVPSPGESITEVEIGNWLVADGAVVTKNQEIAEVESDKATLTVIASESGKITIKAQEGEKVAVGSVVCTIDTSVAAPAKMEEKAEVKTKAEAKTETKAKVEAEVKVEAMTEVDSKVKITEVAKEMMKENGLSVDDIINGLKRIGKKEIEAVLQLPKADTKPVTVQKTATRDAGREKMSSLRRKLSERLVAVKNETAMT